MTRVERGGNKWGMEDNNAPQTAATPDQPGQTLGVLSARLDELAEATAALIGRVAALEARVERVIAGTCPQFLESQPEARPDPESEPAAE